MSTRGPNKEWIWPIGVWIVFLGDKAELTSIIGLRDAALPAVRDEGGEARVVWNIVQ